MMEVGTPPRAIALTNGDVYTESAVRVVAATHIRTEATTDGLSYTTHHAIATRRDSTGHESLDHRSSPSLRSGCSPPAIDRFTLGTDTLSTATSVSRSYALKVAVLRATGLRDPDVPDDDMNPYVEMQLQGQTHHTVIAWGQTDPVWDGERFTFILDAIPAATSDGIECQDGLHVTVFRKVLGGRNLTLGHGVVSLLEMPRNIEVRAEVPLEGHPTASVALVLETVGWGLPEIDLDSVLPPEGDTCSRHSLGSMSGMLQTTQHTTMSTSVLVTDQVGGGCASDDGTGSEDEELISLSSSPREVGDIESQELYGRQVILDSEALEWSEEFIIAYRLHVTQLEATYRERVQNQRSTWIIEETSSRTGIMRMEKEMRKHIAVANASELSALCKEFEKSVSPSPPPPPPPAPTTPNRQPHQTGHRYSGGAFRPTESSLRRSRATCHRSRSPVRGLRDATTSPPFTRDTPSPRRRRSHHNTSPIARKARSSPARAMVDESEWQRQRATWEKELGRFRTEGASLRTEVETSRQELKRTHIELAAKQKEVEQARLQHKHYRQEIERQQEQLRVVAQKSTQQQTQKEHLSHELRKRHRSVADLERRKTELDEEYTERVAQTEQLRALESEFRKRVDAMKQEDTRQREYHQEEVLQRQRHMMLWDEEVRRKRDETEKLKEHLIKRRQEIVELDTRMEASRAALRQLEVAAEQGRRAVGEVEVTEGAIAHAVRQRVVDLETEMTRNWTERQDLKAELSSLRTISEATITDLRRQVAILEESRRSGQPPSVAHGGVQTEPPPPLNPESNPPCQGPELRVDIEEEHIEISTLPYLLSPSTAVSSPPPGDTPPVNKGYVYLDSSSTNLFQHATCSPPAPLPSYPAYTFPDAAAAAAMTNLSGGYSTTEFMTYPTPFAGYDYVTSELTSQPFGGPVAVSDIYLAPVSPRGPQAAYLPPSQSMSIPPSANLPTSPPASEYVNVTNVTTERRMSATCLGGSDPRTGSPTFRAMRSAGTSMRQGCGTCATCTGQPTSPPARALT